MPFFLLASGYSIAQKAQATRLSVIGSVNKLLSIFIINNFICIICYLLDGDSTTNVKLTLAGLLAERVGHLWLVSPSIFGLLVLQYIATRYTARIMLLLVIVLLLILAGDSYSRLSGITLQYEAARYLISIPCLTGGYLLAKQAHLVQRIPVGVYIAGIIAGLVLQFVEAYELYKHAGSSPHNNELTCS